MQTLTCEGGEGAVFTARSLPYLRRGLLAYTYPPFHVFSVTSNPPSETQFRAPNYPKPSLSISALLWKRLLFPGIRQLVAMRLVPTVSPYPKTDGNKPTKAGSRIFQEEGEVRAESQNMASKDAKLLLEMMSE